MAAYRNSLEHLRDELRRLDVLLQRAVAGVRGRRRSDATAEFRGLYISDQEVTELMVAGRDPDPGVEPEKSKLAALCSEIEDRVRESQRSGVFLRLLHLSVVFGLSPFERDVLLLALAPEIDLRY